jgi:hypothetical protein
MSDLPTLTPTTSARLRQVPASQGIQWVRQGFRVFARKPLAFTALLGTFLFFALVCALVPYLGSLVLLMSLPVISLGFMLAGQSAVQDRFALPGIFLVPLRQDPARRKAQIQLGVAYAIGTLVIVVLSEWIDGGRLAAVQELMASGKAEQAAMAAALSDARFQAGLLARLGLMTLLGLPFWHAPALVHWAGHGAMKSIFSSWIACWRNKGAFFVYGAGWLLLLLAAAATSSFVLGLIGSPQLAGLLVLPITLLFVTVFYASLYFTFADCFDLGPLPRSDA